MKQKEPNKYIFPNAMAKMMKNVDMKTQLEASMMSMSLLLLGMVLMSVYSLIYLTQGLVFKILLVFNLIAGMIFMSSFLVTTYQQYHSYLSIMQLQQPIQDQTVETKVIKPAHKKSKKNQFKFLFGLISIGLSILPLFLDGLPAEIFNYRYYILGVGIILGLLFIRSALNKKNRVNPQLTQEQIEKLVSTRPINPANPTGITSASIPTTPTITTVQPNPLPLRIKSAPKQTLVESERIKKLINALQNKLVEIDRVKAERR